MAGKTKAETTASLLLVVSTVLIYIWDSSPEAFGMYSGQMWYTRFTYQFLHASIWHLAINIWVMASITRTYRIRLWHLTTAYFISVPPILLGSIPTIGLSGMCYALMGIIWYQVLKAWFYNVWILGFILVSFLFPHSNGWLHLYCYTIGFIVGLLNKPVNHEN